MSDANNTQAAPKVNPGPSKDLWDEALNKSGFDPKDVAEYNIQVESSKGNAMNPDIQGIMIQLKTMIGVPQLTSNERLRCQAALLSLGGDADAAIQVLEASKIPQALWDAAKAGALPDGMEEMGMDEMLAATARQA